MMCNYWRTHINDSVHLGFVNKVKVTRLEPLDLANSEII
jgi:hypothetical protein